MDVAPGVGGRYSVRPHFHSPPANEVLCPPKFSRLLGGVPFLFSSGSESRELVKSYRVNRSGFLFVKKHNPGCSLLLKLFTSPLPLCSVFEEEGLPVPFSIRWRWSVVLTPLLNTYDHRSPALLGGNENPS